MKDATIAPESSNHAETKLSDSVGDSHCEGDLIDTEKIQRVGWQMAAAAEQRWVGVGFLHKVRLGVVSTHGRDSRIDLCQSLVVP